MTSPGSKREYAPGSRQAHNMSNYHVADLPQEEVAKIRDLEEQLSEDVGKEIVVVAYEKEPESPG